jgi:hypothetical protein
MSLLAASRGCKNHSTSQIAAQQLAGVAAWGLDHVQREQQDSSTEPEIPSHEEPIIVQCRSEQLQLGPAKHQHEDLVVLSVACNDEQMMVKHRSQVKNPCVYILEPLHAKASRRSYHQSLTSARCLPGSLTGLQRVSDLHYLGYFAQLTAGLTLCARTPWRRQQIPARLDTRQQYSSSNRNA